MIARYEQNPTLPDGRSITLLWDLTLERGEPSQGGGWGIADASLEGFIMHRGGPSFALGDTETRKLLEEYTGAEWLTARENALYDLDADFLERLAGHP